jgi:predicted amidohydrolase YtcJ
MKSGSVAYDMAIINANVITLNKMAPKAQAVGVIGERIASIGTDGEINAGVGPNTKVIDAKGKTVLPGFHDSHMHPLLVGHFANGVILNDVKNVKEFLAKIKEKADKTPKGKMILGSGWNQELWEDRRYPTRWEVDSVAPNNPVFLIHWNAHIYLCNSLLMHQKGVDRNTPSPDGGTIEKDAKGEPTGILLENAINLVAPGFLETGAGLFSYEETKEALRYCAMKAAEWGLTSIVDILAGDAQVKAYQELEAEGKLPVRINFYLGYQLLDSVINLGIMSGFGNKKIRFAGMKMITDGSLSSHTAALRQPYVDMPGTSGVMRISTKEIEEFVHKATANGIRVDLHALGDKAIEEVLRIFRKVNKELKPKDPRFKISHAILLAKDLIPQLSELDVIASVQPVFITGGQHWIPRQVGPERANYAHAYHFLQEAGVHMCTGTDAPIGDMNPLVNVYVATVRKDLKGVPEGGWHPEQSISVEQALRMGTIEGAYATGQENVKGTLEVGKLADMAVFSDDPLKVKPDQIKDIKNIMTIVGGKVVYAAP